MKISDIGGEFALIDRLAHLLPADHQDLVVGVGDDAAVIRTAPEPAPYLLVTTDILVAGRHFNTEWAGARQIGIKSAECNISDIAAMGGTPTWMFISLVLSRQTDVEWAEELYRGVAASCQRHGVVVAGGDTTQGAVDTVNIALLGSVAPDELCLRRHARPGDVLMVTGTLGASAAGLNLLSGNRRIGEYLREKHLAPTCRLDAARPIARLAHAMIDISDGLGSEVYHICEQSGTGAEIEKERIPLHPEVLSAARLLEADPYAWALSGGEDFELLFSIAPHKVAALQSAGVACHPVGHVTEAGDGIVLVHPDGSRTPLPGGYDHFRSNFCVNP
jgi:thiamine-monophosphate kinase